MCLGIKLSLSEHCGIGLNRHRLVMLVTGHQTGKKILSYQKKDKLEKRGKTVVLVFSWFEEQNS